MAAKNGSSEEEFDSAPKVEHIAISDSTKEVLGSGYSVAGISGSVSSSTTVPPSWFGSTSAGGSGGSFTPMTEIPDKKYDPLSSQSGEFVTSVGEGTLLVEKDEATGEMRATIAGSHLVRGDGDTAPEAVEDLQRSIADLLDFVFGASGQSRPTLHGDFLDEVTKLTHFSKQLGIYTP